MNEMRRLRRVKVLYSSVVSDRIIIAPSQKASRRKYLKPGQQAEDAVSW